MSRSAKRKKKKKEKKREKKYGSPGGLGSPFSGVLSGLRPLVYCILAHLECVPCRHAPEQSHCYGVPGCRSPASSVLWSCAWA